MEGYSSLMCFEDFFRGGYAADRTGNTARFLL